MENDAKAKAKKELDDLLKGLEQYQEYSPTLRAQIDSVAFLRSDTTTQEQWEEYLSTPGLLFKMKVNSFSHDWARYMQIQLNKGKKLDTIWHKTMKELTSVNDVSFAMLACITEDLYHFWVHGKPLAHLINTRYKLFNTIE